MGKPSTSSSSSSNSRRRTHNSSHLSSSITHQNIDEQQHLHHHPDLNLGLSISRGHWQPFQQQQGGGEVNDCNDYGSFFVKVYMEGIPIGRKLNLLAHNCYQELVNTLEHMFDTTILCNYEQCPLLFIYLSICVFLIVMKMKLMCHVFMNRGHWDGWNAIREMSCANLWRWWRRFDYGWRCPLGVSLLNSGFS